MALVLVISDGKTQRVEGVGASLVLLLTEHSGDLSEESGEITMTWGKHQSELYITRKSGVRQRNR